MVRPSDPVDGATPSGASLIAEALLTVGHLVDGDWAGRYGEAAAEHAARALAAAGPGPAVGRALAGGGRGRGARAAADRRRDTGRRFRAAGRRARSWRRAGRSSSAAPVDSSPLLAGRDRVAGPTRPMCAAAGCAICRSRAPRNLPRRSGCPCSVPAMPSADRLRQTVHRISSCVAKGNADEITALYADDATVEDPVGGEVHIGRQAIHDSTLRRKREQPNRIDDAAGAGPRGGVLLGADAIADSDADRAPSA